MAILKNLEGIGINATNSTNTGYGSRIYTSTRTWPAFTSGINMFQIYQNGATATRQTLSISLRWAAIRTSDPKTELPALFATGRASLNTNGTMSYDSFDWQSWGGNGIMWPYVQMGGSSLFIGGNNGGSTGIIGSVHVTFCCMAWDNLVVNVFSD